MNQEIERELNEAGAHYAQAFIAGHDDTVQISLPVWSGLLTRADAVEYLIRIYSFVEDVLAVIDPLPEPPVALEDVQSEAVAAIAGASSVEDILGVMTRFVGALPDDTEPVSVRVKLSMFDDKAEDEPEETL